MTYLIGPLFTLTVVGLILGYWVRRMSREHRARMAEIEADAQRWADRPAAAALLDALRNELLAVEQTADPAGLVRRFHERGWSVTPVLRDGRWQVLVGPLPATNPVG